MNEQFLVGIGYFKQFVFSLEDVVEEFCTTSNRILKFAAVFYPCFSLSLLFLMQCFFGSNVTGDEMTRVFWQSIKDKVL